jgi:argininosuccinate lyase
VAMLAKQKILSKKDACEILSALLKLKQEFQNNLPEIDYRLEDVHTFIENKVREFTSVGKKMHMARSRNDQIALDMRLFMRSAINEISLSLLNLQKSLILLSKKDNIFPAYTHTQVAQPVSLYFWANSHFWEIERDLERLDDLYKRVNKNPLGSAAVAGTSWNIDRNYTSMLLGFDSPTENPMDSVSNRGELETEFLGDLYLSMAHCSRIAEDLILLSSKQLIILPDEYSTGSSIMPQKKNPDPLELIRGKTARLLGLYVHSASLLKGVPSGYNLDSQESKYALFEGTETALLSFSILSELLPHIELNIEKIKAELEEGFASATALADLLAQKGIPFRDAHAITGKIVNYCIKNKKHLSQLSLQEIKAIADVTISQEELSKATSVDKVKEFSQKYHFPKKLKYEEIIQKRIEKISSSEKILEKELKKYI